MRVLTWLRTSALLATLATALLCGSTRAQTRVDETLLHLSETELQARLPELRRAAKPVVGPRGLRGTWTAPGARLQGLALDTTFYLRAKSVQRIEQRWASTSARDCTPQLEQALAADLETRWGASVSTTEDTGTPEWQRATLWTQGDAEARLLFSQTGGQCAVMLVYAPYLPKDAATL
ncbi:hypothetical protein [Rhodoferax saidenbachensis]|uniref:Secreted protein n=1 Tax=Rhodoferax saidenbachensis TaxID=1484693 RepID=A0ABU1ZKB2_9BURK|nr:hypothetical protein [Rhodoferax saidenbachensis]MDR7305990.1 hypothetical protein [Rhodoferax saidenbachensis]